MLLPYSFRILEITGENPQHQEHIGSAKYQIIGELFPASIITHYNQFDDLAFFTG